ncbi:hypothetical protein F4Y93_05915 [Candidatus Poribacteria bacterium]|nr:hypothetical protein [Candidatus Poribacteria bacterium]
MDFFTLVFLILMFIVVSMVEYRQRMAKLEFEEKLLQLRLDFIKARRSDLCDSEVDDDLESS